MEYMLGLWLAALTIAMLFQFGWSASNSERLSALEAAAEKASEP